MIGLGRWARGRRVISVYRVGLNAGSLVALALFVRNS